MTAAHCVSPIETFVHLGVHNEAQDSILIREVVKSITHPNFVPAPTFLNDIALLRVSPPIDLSLFTGKIGLSCLPPPSATTDYPNPGSHLAVVGWGRMSSSGSRSTILRQVRVYAMDEDDPRCINARYDSDRQFCAMVDGGGKDSCQGNQHAFSHEQEEIHFSFDQVTVVDPFTNG